MSVEEIFRNFIKAELYEIVDMVVENHIDIHILNSKADKLEALINEYLPDEDLPEYRQAMFIISNAYRKYNEHNNIPSES